MATVNHNAVDTSVFQPVERRAEIKIKVPPICQSYHGPKQHIRLRGLPKRQKDRWN